jgi:hypothetical protein
MQYVPPTEELKSQRDSPVIVSEPEEKHENLHKVNLKEESNIEDTKIFDFLKFCHKNREMDVYYLLLNEVEIDFFISGKAEIAGKIANNMQAKIEKLLN